MTSSISPGVSRNSGMLGWMPSAKGRCRSATAYLRCKVRNGGAFVSGLSLSCSMPWHCAQCKPTNLNPRRSAGGCSARAASIAHSRIRPSVIAGHGLRAGYFRAPFRSGVFGFACNSARHIRGHGPKWRSRGFSGFGLREPKHGLRNTAGTDHPLASRLLTTPSVSERMPRNGGRLYRIAHAVGTGLLLC